MHAPSAQDKNGDFPLFFLFKQGFTSARRHLFPFVDGWSGPYPEHVAKQGRALTGARVVPGPTMRALVDVLDLNPEANALKRTVPEAPGLGTTEASVPPVEEAPETEAPEPVAEPVEEAAVPGPIAFVPGTEKPLPADPDDLAWAELKSVMAAVKASRFDWTEQYGSQPKKQDMHLAYHKMATLGHLVVEDAPAEA